MPDRSNPTFPHGRRNMNVASTAETPVTNRRVAFVGKLGSMNRKQARQVIREKGGSVTERVDPSVDLIVIGADQLPVTDGQLLDDTIIDAAERGDLRIISETELWQELGHVDESAEASLYTPAMLAHLLNLPISTIRRWIRRGLIKPVKQFKNLSYFDFQEVASARNIAGLIAEGNSPKSIESKLSKLAQLYPHLDRPLSQLSVIISGRDVLLRQGQGLVAPGGGQMLFDFDADISEDAGTIPMPGPAVISIHTSLDEPEAALSSSTEGLTTRQEFMQLAIELEDAEQLESATEVYRTMGLAIGPSAEASFRLAEILYLQGNLQAARERYYTAIELDGGFVEARASLGCVLVELGQKELAVSAFRGALEHHEEYPDVHFHLARLLDEQKEREKAETHWRRFLDLAPVSPWAIEARERLGIRQ
ncbi:MAG: tetratricopeptide repeat protein [Planctomycetota bacterium]